LSTFHSASEPGLTSWRKGNAGWHQGNVRVVGVRYLRCHGASAGSKTTYSPTHVKLIPGKLYWVNLHFDGDAGTVSEAVFDRASGFAQVGPMMVAQSTTGARVYGFIRFGQTSAHGDHPDATTQSCFDNIVVDFSHAVFPLLPSTGNH